MLKNGEKAEEYVTQVPGLSMMKGAPLELFLTDRANLLSQEHLDSPRICSLLAMEVIYFLNCPQLLQEFISRSALTGNGRLD